jgi:hypothetical protein
VYVIDRPLLALFSNNGFNELQNLKYLPRSMIEREIVFEDRTPAHADHVGFGFDRKTTAAVGESQTPRTGRPRDQFYGTPFRPKSFQTIFFRGKRDKISS